MDATIEIWESDPNDRVTTRVLLEIASHQKVVGH